MQLTSSLNSLLQFGPLGEFICTWGSGTTLRNPKGLAVSPVAGEVFVVDGHRVQAFSTRGDFLYVWGGKKGDAFDKLHSPSALAFHPSGAEMYVCDEANNRIIAIDPRPRDANWRVRQTALRQWGSHGVGSGQFERPCGVACSPVSGHIFVVDAGQSRVQVFL